jgi:branched-chain amino acid transport system substrate-binding protein
MQEEKFVMPKLFSSFFVISFLRKKHYLPLLCLISWWCLSLLLTACGDNSSNPSGTPLSTANLTTSETTSGADNDANVIRIYNSLPISSDKDLFATYRNAGELAIADYTNGTGKIGNFVLDYVVVDDANSATQEWDGALERAIANKAASDSAVMVYLGPTNSGAAKISIPILNQAGIAMISPGATYSGLTHSNPGLTRAGEPNIYYPTQLHNFFRVVAPDDVQAPAILEFLKNLKVHKIFIIDDSQVYGRGLADAIEAGCPKVGFDCSHRTSINGREADYKALAAGIKQVNPDVIFFGGIVQQQAAKLIQDIRAAGIQVPFMGGGSFHSDMLIQQAGAASEGIYAINAGTAEQYIPAKGQDFLKRYIAKYGDTGLNQAFTRQAYEAMAVALTALKQVDKKDRKAIIEALANIKNFDGVLGQWSFDANGDTSQNDFTVWQVGGGAWKAITLVKPKL